MWLIIALIGYSLLAVVGVLDKLILDKKLKHPVVFVFYSTVFVLPLFLLLPFGVIAPTTGLGWVIVAVAGIAFALALWVMYIGYQKSEVSHVGPLVGAMIPVFVIILSQIFLHEFLTERQWIAAGLIILGSLIISFEKSARHHGWHTGMLFGVLAGLLFAVSHVASKVAYDWYGFYSGFVWTRGFLGLCALPLIFTASVRAEIFSWRHRQKTAKRAPHKIALIASNKILGTLGVVFIQYAIAIGSVSLVNALHGFQYALLVLAVFLLSRFWPKIFKEQYSRGEIIQEFSAIAIIAVGLAFLF